MSCCFPAAKQWCWAGVLGLISRDFFWFFFLFVSFFLFSIPTDRANMKKCIRRQSKRKNGDGLTRFANFFPSPLAVTKSFVSLLSLVSNAARECDPKKIVSAWIHSNTYPSSRLISQSIVIDHFDFELKDHRAPVEILGAIRQTSRILFSWVS